MTTSRDRPLVSLNIRRGVAVVTRDNPPVNALTLATTRELNDVLTRLADSSEVNAVVMTGGGSRSFGAGSDIREFASLIAGRDVVERKMRFENETFSLLAQLPKPTIAALNGSAYGGGLEIALACDFIIAEHGQHVGLPEVKLGLFPSSGGPVRLTRRIGEARAKTMIFFGDPVPVEQAETWGLVNRLVEPGAALTEAMTWAERLALGSASGLRAAKTAVNAALDGAGGEDTIRAGLDLAGANFEHPDALEGATAFLEKRPPRFPSSGAARE